MGRLTQGWNFLASGDYQRVSRNVPYWHATAVTYNRTHVEMGKRRAFKGRSVHISRVEILKDFTWDVHITTYW